MIIRVQTDDFDVSKVNAELQRGRSDTGAIVNFIGLVRDLADDKLFQMTLEHYPGMTEKALQTIAQQANQRWQVQDLAIIHRVGELKPADQIVMVSVLSAHRKDAFDACEFIMDYLKTDAPFWKKEISESGSSWVESKKCDADARNQWEK
ncbi:MAG: molybdopterin synthase catalytic subunit [Planctomycetota bacterium]|jgi:molybdopterin synthase catalytic subunit